MRGIYGDNVHKKVHNAAFSELVRAEMTFATWQQDDIIVALDGRERNTSAEILASLPGITKNNILLIESDVATAKNHLDAGYVCHAGDVSDFADSRWDVKYTQPGQSWRKYPVRGAYFDMYCALTVNTRDDICSCIHKLNITHGCVLAFTFSLRGRERRRTTAAHAQLATYINAVLKPKQLVFS